MSQHDIFLAKNDPANINWSNPAACIEGGSATVNFGEALENGGKYILAARARSFSGRQEQNTHVIRCFEIDQAGQLVPWGLASPCDVSVRLEAPDVVCVYFSAGRQIGCEWPDRFEILSDGGSGQLNLSEPVAVVENFSMAQIDFSATAAVVVLPAMFAVRPSRQGRPGPISRIVRIVGASAPSAVSLL